MILAVFDPSPLTLCVDKLLFFYLYLLFYYQFQYFSFYIFRKFKRMNDDFHIKMMAFCLLGLFNSDFFLAHRVQKANVHQHSKFHWNQSNGSSDTVVFSIFKMAATCKLGFLKSQTFIGWWGPEGRDASSTKPPKGTSLRESASF